MDKMNFFAETSEDDKMRQEDKEFFIQYNHVECGGDKAIIEFIANFRFLLYETWNTYRVQQQFAVCLKMDIILRRYWKMFFLEGLSVYVIHMGILYMCTER